MRWVPVRCTRWQVARLDLPGHEQVLHSGAIAVVQPGMVQPDPKLQAVPQVCVLRATSFSLRQHDSRSSLPKDQRYMRREVSAWNSVKGAHVKSQQYFFYVHYFIFVFEGGSARSRALWLPAP